MASYDNDKIFYNSETYIRMGTSMSGMVLKVYRKYDNDDLHRTDGPAVEFSDGGNQWWLHGAPYKFDVWIIKNNLTELNKVRLILEYG